METFPGERSSFKYDEFPLYQFNFNGSECKSHYLSCIHNFAFSITRGKITSNIKTPNPLKGWRFRDYDKRRHWFIFFLGRKVHGTQTRRIWRRTLWIIEINARSQKHLRFHESPKRMWIIQVTSSFLKWLFFKVPNVALFV